MKKTLDRHLRHIPNFLSISRIFLTFVIVYMIFVKSNIIIIISVFAFAALTDWADGFLARKFKWTSEFGRKADMVADRFLWIWTAGAFVISFGIDGLLTWVEGVQIMFIMSREIISGPFALISIMMQRPIPNARYIAKVTTFVQGFALPALILSIYFPLWSYLSIPLSFVCLVTGSLSARYYIKDTKLSQTFDRKID